MRALYSLLRYIAYLIFAISIGLLSFLGDVDFIHKNHDKILTLVLTLTVLNITLTNLLIHEIFKFKELYNQAITLKPIRALRRNAYIELFIIFITFIILSIEGVTLKYLNEYTSYIKIGVNALIAFDFLYFLLIIFDSVNGWYKLLETNESVKNRKE